MWHSEADILNDLISLDDFGVSGKDESYKVLYSRGRGFKTQQKPKLTDSFIDSRTGEVINLNDDSLEPNDYRCKSKGRGSALGSFLKSRDQLQKQLRLARPLGSGDNAIEAFCRRNSPAERQESTSDSESDAIKTEISVNGMYSPFNSLIKDNKRQRVKATRNSRLQHNVLINGLLSKGKCASSLSSITEKSNLRNGDNDDDENENENEGSKGDSSVNSLCSSFDLGLNSIKSIESDIETYGSDIHAKIDCVNIQEKDDVKLNLRFDVEKNTNNSSKECKGQEEKLNKKIYAFGESLNHLTLETTDSFDEAEHLYGSTSEDFTINNDDFPPLKRNNLS